ncbi:MAG TPA: RNA polymerase Rpb4 family protein [Methanocellales archaeon]|nr:RNA polymerase Rpb4 family protein [Methanocellales archaeon]
MIIKEVVSEELLTLAEIKNILNKIQDERLKNGEELRYEQRRAIEHANKFAKTSAESSRALVEALLKLEKMKPEIAIRIADIMPKTKDELRSIYAKERYTLVEKELETILGLVNDRA